MPSPLAAATPRLTVQYGSYSIDESNGCILSSEYDADDTRIFGSFYIEFRCRLLAQTGVVATDDAAFKTLIAALEAALLVPRQRLLVKFGAQPFRDWNYGTSPAQTALLIEPELKLIEENCRDYRYGFRVRCQFPGNVPGNYFRRESLTQIGTSLRERRTVTISGQWTSDTTKTAYQRYLDSTADNFFTGALPANFTDAITGTVGTWELFSQDPSYNDENSVLNVTRTYWEIFHGRRDAQRLTINTIGGRRVCTIPSVWAASVAQGALENYNSYGDALFADWLPTPVASGEWVLVDEEPSVNDQDGLLAVTRTYHEVVHGLRQYEVHVTTGANGLRRVVVSGVFYATQSTTAFNNYSAQVVGLVNLAIANEGIIRYESHSIPKVTGYDTTGLRYFFEWTILELAYAQGASVDDPNVTFETLDIQTLVPFEAQAIGSTIVPDRLKTVEARFVAVIDYQQNQDPVGLWQSGLRDHVLGAVTSKLGSYVSAVEVVEEDVGPGLHSNQLVGTLRMIVTGGSILSYNLVQRITQVPGRDFVGRGDGTPFSYYPYRALPEKLLYRECTLEYVVGSAPTDFFADTTLSGFGIVDTGATAQASVDAQNATSTLSFSEWFIDRRASEPYSYTDVPTTRGDGSSGSPYRTVVHRQVENWRFCAALEPGTTI